MVAAEAPVCIASGGSAAASCSGTLPMPLAGRQFWPVARHRMTNSNSRDVTLRAWSKNMPPRKGRKNLYMMASEKPSACMRDSQHHFLHAVAAACHLPHKNHLHLEG